MFGFPLNQCESFEEFSNRVDEVYGETIFYDMRREVIHPHQDLFEQMINDRDQYMVPVIGGSDGFNASIGIDEEMFEEYIDEFDGELQAELMGLVADYMSYVHTEIIFQGAVTDSEVHDLLKREARKINFDEQALEEVEAELDKLFEQLENQETPEIPGTSDSEYLTMLNVVGQLAKEESSS